MKRTISTLLLVLLCLMPISVRYWIQETYGAECEDSCSDPVQLARMSPAVLGASSGAAGPIYTDCSQFPAGYSFYYNADYSGDTDKGCSGASTAMDGTLGAGIEIVNSASDPGVVSGESGGNVVKFTSTTNEYIQWSITSDDIIDDSEGYMSFDIYAASTEGYTAAYFLYYSSINYLSFRVASDGAIRLDHQGNGTRVYLDSTAKLPDTTWTTLQFRWSVATGKIALKIGANAWQEQAGTVTAFSTPSATLKLNCALYADTLYLDNVKVSKTSGF